MSASSGQEYAMRTKAADYDAEKTRTTTTTTSQAVQGEKYAEGLGDLQVFKTSDSENLKLAKDGKTVLIP